ncbi:MAG: zinc ribbon domain-containing protein [Defluviitaleaceae bacterium]|nr:zinc ribbon domain-containing protein [Defluviitaleaceae bacterium]
MANDTCNKCGAKIPEFGRFCEFCGAAVEIDTSAHNPITENAQNAEIEPNFPNFSNENAAITTVFCTKCGAKIPEFGRFCEFCGAAADVDTAVPNPTMETAQNAEIKPEIKIEIEPEIELEIEPEIEPEIETEIKIEIEPETKEITPKIEPYLPETPVVANVAPEEIIPEKPEKPESPAEKYDGTAQTIDIIETVETVETVDTIDIIDDSPLAKGLPDWSIEPPVIAIRRKPRAL